MSALRISKIKISKPRAKKTSSKNWISSAIKNPGGLTKKAKAAGVSVPVFESKVESNPNDFSTTTKRQVNLAETLSGFKKKRGKKTF